MVDSWMLHPSQGLIRLGGHQLVQAGVAGKAVLEGDDVPGAADEAAARRHIGDVPQLGVGDVQEARQLVTVCGGLIQQDEELFASMRRAVSERSSSSTFCVSPVTRPLYLRMRFHSL